MKIPHALTMASALLLVAGCAHNRETAQYDESISPAYSAGRMSDYDNDHNTLYSSPLGPGATAAVGKSATQSDNSIVASVRESLRRNAEIAPIVPNIQISANNGAIILSGSVQSQEQKRQIAAIAQQAPGVVAVNDQMEVLSTPSQSQTGMENQGANSPLNPTSTATNNPPSLYQNAGSGAENSDTSALSPSSATSTVSNSPPRLYQNAGEQNGQPQTTNNNPSTNDSLMH